MWFSRDYANKLNYPLSCELLSATGWNCSIEWKNPNVTEPTRPLSSSLDKAWSGGIPREEQIERAASPQEAIDYSIKKTELPAEVVESSRSDKAESDTENTPLGDDYASDKSTNSTRYFLLTFTRITKKKIISAILQFSYQTVNLDEQNSLLILSHKHRNK